MCQVCQCWHWQNLKQQQHAHQSQIATKSVASLSVLALSKPQTAATCTSVPNCYQMCAKSASSGTGKISNSSDMHIIAKLLPKVCQVCQCWHCRISWQWHDCQCWHWSGAVKPNGIGAFWCAYFIFYMNVSLLKSLFCMTETPNSWKRQNNLQFLCPNL